jgi:hypothetical protein
MTKEIQAKKVSQTNTQTAYIGSQVVQVGLSNSNQSHRTYLSIEHNIYTNEARIKAQSFEIQSLKSLLTPFQSIENRYKRSGAITCNGLSKKGRSKIKLASRVIESINHLDKSKPATSTMITLTYGKDFPTDHLSKKHLDIFLKRLKRLNGIKSQYLWVAEKQKRGAIHFHILTPDYTPKVWLNDAWNDIVNKWLASTNKTPQTLYPNVIKVNSAGAYLSKYLQKEGQNIGGNGYGIDQITRQMMKPNLTHFASDESSILQTNAIADELTASATKKTAVNFTWKTRENLSCSWISDLNTFAIDEFIKYGMEQNGFKPIKEFNVLQSIKINEIEKILNEKINIY